MIELTNTAAQVIQPGQAVTFNKIVHQSKCNGSECFNEQIPNSVKLKYNGIYEVHFSGNIGGTTAGTPVQLAVALGGYPAPETVMVSTPAAANDFNNVATSTLVKNGCCDCGADRVSVVNTGTVPVLLSANFNLYVIRKS